MGACAPQGSYAEVMIDAAAGARHAGEFAEPNRTRPHGGLLRRAIREVFR